MLILFAAFFECIVFAAGGIFVFRPLPGLALMSFACVALGVIAGVLQRTGTSGAYIEEGVVTLGALRDVKLPDSTVLYTTQNGHLGPATGVFDCRLNGQIVAVIKRNDNAVTAEQLF